MKIFKQYIKLRERSLDTKDQISMKRFVTVVSHDLFVIQIIINMFLTMYLTIFHEPKLGIEHHKLLVYCQITGLFCNLLIVLWGLNAIKNVDVAFANLQKSAFKKKHISDNESPDDCLTQEGDFIRDES